MRRVLVLILLVLACIAVAFLMRETRDRGSPADGERVQEDGAAAVIAESEDEASGIEVDTARVDVVAPSAPPVPDGGRLRVRVVWSDGSPAPDVGVRCHGRYPQQLPGGVRLAISKPDGEAVFEGLGTRKVTIQSFRGGLVKAESIAGRETEATLKLEKGVRVEGRVVDAGGLPVAKAKVWMTTGYTNWLGGRFVAESDADGVFSLRAVALGESIGAVCAGYLRSDFVDLDMLDTSASPVKVELVLRRGGAALRCRVVDAQQNAVAGARIAVGTMPRRFEQRSTGRGGWAQKEAWTPRVVETDERGFAEVHGMPEGEHPVVVRHESAAIWKGSAMLRVAETEELRVELRAGVVVHGRVTDAYAKPVDGSSVRAIDAEFDEVYLQSGQFDFDSVLGYPATKTDAQGRYRLEHVAAGTIYLHAQMPRKTRGRKTLYRAKHEVQAVDGGTIEWSPRLDAGATIEGRVSFRCGTPMKNVFVTAKEVRSGKRNVINNGDDGRFRFVNLEQTAYEVSVQLWSPPKGAKPVKQDEVWPGGELLDLRSDFDAPVKLAPGEVVGTFEDEGKRVANATALNIHLVSEGRSWRTCRKLQEKDGATLFRFDGIRPGRYRITAKSHEDLIYAGDWFTVQAKATLDVGVIRTAPAASARFRLKREAGTEGSSVRIFVRAPNCKIHATRIDLGKRNDLVHENLPQGKCTMSVYARGAITVKREIELTRGNPREIEIDLRVQYRLTIGVALPDSMARESIAVQVQDLSGKSVWKANPSEVAKLEKPYRFHAHLPRAGRFVVQARIGRVKVLREEVAIPVDASQRNEVSLRW